MGGGHGKGTRKMAVITSAAIAGAASLASGAMSSSGQRAANAANERIARENRAFQERMSSTAYQRAATDLDKAGLNRILALGSPASSPGGSTAVMQNPREGMAKGVSSAVSAALQAQQTKLTNDNIEEDTGLKYDTRANTRATEAKTLAEAKKVEAETLNIYKQGLNLDTDLKIKQFESEIKKAQLPGIKTEADLWLKINEMDLGELAKALGKAGPILAPLLRAVIVGMMK